MRLSEGNPFKTCASPQAHNQKLNRANRYENEMVLTYRDLNCSGASPNERAGWFILAASKVHKFICWGSASLISDTLAAAKVPQ